MNFGTAVRDALAIGGAFLVVMAAPVALAMAAIGTLDHETRPLLATGRWLAAREKTAVTFMRARRMWVIGLLFPQRGRHLAGEQHPLDEEETDAPETPARDRQPRPEEADPSGEAPQVGQADAAVPARRQPEDAPGTPAERPADDVEALTDDWMRDHHDEWASGRFTHDGEDDDTDTLRIFADANAEHLVPPHEPDPPGPDTPSLPGEKARLDAVTPTGTGPGAPARQPSGESGEPGAKAAAYRPFRRLPAADLNARIEAARQATTADPCLFADIRAALGFDSVDCWADHWDSMRRKLTAGAHA